MAYPFDRKVRGGQTIERKMDMPKKSERERLADLEARQRKVAEDVEKARRALRGKYAAIVPEHPVETLTEREFREVVELAIRAGGGAQLRRSKPCRQQPPTNDTHPEGMVPATSTAEPRAGGRCDPHRIAARRDRALPRPVPRGRRQDAR